MVNENINVIYADLPARIRAYTIANVDGSYTVVLNSRLSFEQLRRSYAHELAHIRCGDYELRTDIGILEEQRHT